MTPSQLKKYIRDNHEKTERLISRAEIAGLMLAILSVILMTQKINGASQLMIIGLSLLAFVYAFLGNFSKEIFELEKTDSFSLALFAGYIGLSVTAMGVLFIMQRWPGADIILKTGSFVTGAMFLFFIYKMYFATPEDEKHKVIINNIIVRMLPALLVVAFFISMALRGK